MSIVRLKKATVVGLAKDKFEILKGLQELGVMHLTPLQEKPHSLAEQQHTPATESVKALRYLRESPVKRRQIHHDPDFDIHDVTELVLLNQERRRSTMDRKDELNQRLKDLEPWGDFSFPPLDDIGGERLWFYTLPRRELIYLEELRLPWEIVHLNPSTAWVVIISPEEPPRDILPVERTHTGSSPLRDVREDLDAIESELDEIEADRQSLTRWITLLMRHMARAEDKAELEFALDHSAEGDICFAVQGWVPADKIDDVAAFTDNIQLAVIFEEPRPEDEPPTLLRTPQGISAGTDLVGFYQMPSYRGWDPSRILFFSFALFFAMILSDAGYAALLGVALAAFWRKLGRAVGGQRWRSLLAMIVSTSVIWGIMVGSYFGLEPPQESWLYAFKVFDLNDFDAMMKLSVSIGAIHIAMANLQMTMLWWGHKKAGVHLGWIMVLSGGMMIWLESTGDIPGASWPGGSLFAIGLTAIFYFSGQRTIDSFKGLLIRILEGLRALSDITRIFGDVLSYLRLFALGLASASLALTFNELARQASESSEGLGLLYAILILLVGHTLNLTLAIISGVVHGLRLNYIEFYNWGLSGEGYPFRAFRKKELNQ
ncbi:MAG: V-type ATP synthase subunit I [Gammaproteobacteria bacterium]|nr:V-type ATP synthase subunit I [Gammaproteobacteria bacterium]